jgi:hypothetical protein
MLYRSTVRSLVLEWPVTLEDDVSRSDHPRLYLFQHYHIEYFLLY